MGAIVDRKDLGAIATAVIIGIKEERASNEIIHRNQREIGKTILVTVGLKTRKRRRRVGIRSIQRVQKKVG